MFLNPARVVEKLDVRPGMKVAEFGSGAGHFTIEMAKCVGREGMAYAFDVRQEALDALRGTADVAHLSNIEIARVDLESDQSTRLSDNLLDFVLISNVLFQVEKKESIIKEAFRVLKKEGRVAVIEWEMFSAEKLGPPKEVRVDKDKIREMFLAAGFKELTKFDAGESHYGLIFKKL